jgi:hypothetical protein
MAEGLSELAADQNYILEVLYDSTSGNYIIWGLILIWKVAQSIYS